MGNKNTMILGAGVTGLAAGIASGFPVYESESVPGGICSSYYIAPNSEDRLFKPPEDDEAYRFEIGGGHWIFGGDPTILEFVKRTVPVGEYKRKSSVYFPESELYVPYPIQNHLSHLGKDIASKALDEIINGPKRIPVTMEEWIEISFGKTLSKLFFAPFHELYTAGLWTEIAPQDPYKSPVNISHAIKGALGEAPSVGYNVTYLYPRLGLNEVTSRMAERSNVAYEKTVAQIDVNKKEVHFTNETGEKFENLISTLPLTKMIEFTGIEIDERPDPYSSVLVLNIGAKRGAKCPEDHWLYITDSKSKFHRVGFYSNVDTSFLPASARSENAGVSIYVERAYLAGEKPNDDEIAIYSAEVVKELQSWGFIEEAEVVDPTWIDVAYTWSWPGGVWKSKAIGALQNKGIYQVGRYARWIFQGIADSLKDGFYAGTALR